MEDGDYNSEKVLILPLNEDSKKITQALSNEKSLTILKLLAQDPMSTTELASSLDMPLTTVKYNLDGLIESDLIHVREIKWSKKGRKIKWSKKGRKIKIYEPVQKLIVVVPGSSNKDRSSIMGMLKKYIGMAAGAIFAASGIEYLTRSSMTGLDQMPTDEVGAMLYETSAPVANETMEGMPMVADYAMNGTAAPAADAGQNLSTMGMDHIVEPASGLLSHDIFSHFSVWFLLGGMFVILILCLREVYYRKRS